MEQILLFVVLICTSAAVIPGYKEHYIEQYLDHFNYQLGAEPHVETFQERYLVTDDYWDKNPLSPILFYTGNEGPITSFLSNTGFVFELAQKFNGLVVFAEHRYYGKSLPFGQDSFTPETIGWLTIEQALADYAVLIKHLKEEYKIPHAPVLAFGGSYGGMLSGYMRYKYPHIINAAVASSAPFLTITGNRPRSEFWKTTTQTFNMSNPKCPGLIKNAFNLMTQASDDMLQKVFRLCDGQTSKKGFMNHALGWVRNAFTLLAMLDYPYPTNFMAPLPGHPVDLACTYATHELGGLGMIMDLLYGNETKVKCHDTYAEYVECADPTGCGTGNDNPAWDYQACTELILPGGSTGKEDMFPKLPFTFEQRHQHCLDRFAVVSNRNDWLSTNFWGSFDDIKQASRIIFPNGNLDPWHPGGVLEDLSGDLVAIMVEGGAHHLDLRSSNPADPQSVIDARLKIEALLKKWVNEDNTKMLEKLRNYRLH